MLGVPIVGATTAAVMAIPLMVAMATVATVATVATTDGVGGDSDAAVGGLIFHSAIPSPRRGQDGRLSRVVNGSPVLLIH